MQRQGLVEAFRQTAGRRLVPVLQFMLERLPSVEGLVVRLTAIGALETLPPHRLLALGHVAHHVLALVPLTPKHQGAVAEGFPHGRPEPLAAIARSLPASPWETSRPRSTIDRRNGVNTCAFSVSVSTKPRNALVPCQGRGTARSPSSPRRTSCRPSMRADDVLRGEVPLLKFAEFGRAGLNERARHRRPRQVRAPLESH